MREYVLTLAERDPPPGREGVTMLVKVQRRSRAAALRGWSDRYMVMDCQPAHRRTPALRRPKLSMERHWEPEP